MQPFAETHRIGIGHDFEMLVPEVSELEHDGSGFKEPKSAYDEASASSRGNSQVRDGTPCANYIAPATTFAPSDNHWIYCLVSCAAIPEASLQRIVGVHLISETCDGEFWGLLASTRGVCALISRRIYPWPGSTRKYDLWQPTMKEAFGRFEDEARTIARGRYNATAFHGVVKHGTPVFHYYRQLCPYHVIATGLFIFRLRVRPTRDSQ